MSTNRRISDSKQSWNQSLLTKVLISVAFCHPLWAHFPNPNTKSSIHRLLLEKSIKSFSFDGVVWNLQTSPKTIPRDSATTMPPPKKKNTCHLSFRLFQKENCVFQTKKIGVNLVFVRNYWTNFSGPRGGDFSDSWGIFVRWVGWVGGSTTWQFCDISGVKKWPEPLQP